MSPLSRLEDALRADVIILAVPFMAHSTIAAAATDWAGKTSCRCDEHVRRAAGAACRQSIKRRRGIRF